MTDKEIIQANDILSKFDLFGGQRAGRELWFDKPVDVQNEDIEKFSKDVAFLKDFINRQQAEIDRYKGVIKILEMDVAAAEIRGAKDFGKYLIDKSIKGFLYAGDIVDYCYDFTHEVTKIEQVEAGDI